MRTNFVLIDFESVRPESLVALEQDHFKVMVFVGANQAKVTAACRGQSQAALRLLVPAPDGGRYAS